MKKVLILDDEQDLLDLWFILFKSWGFNVEIHTALNGKEGLKLFSSANNYDLIITDFKMPIMNGLEFIREVRSIDTSQKPPIFFFTGYLPELTDHIDKLENVLFFDKPLISEKMKTNIKMCLGNN